MRPHMREIPALKGVAADLRDLLNDWDPIGVMSLGAPADEYDCMIPHLLVLIERRADADQFAAYLTREMTEHFGLGPVPDIMLVARRLVGVSRAAQASTPPTQEW